MHNLFCERDITRAEGSITLDASRWFTTLTGHASPHPWQRELIESHEVRDRLVRVPTGMGKTQGVLAAWARNRLVEKNPDWPTRLVWCLPMRVLVEQTADVVRGFLERAKELGGASMDACTVHRLLPVEDGEDLDADRDAVNVLSGIAPEDYEIWRQAAVEQALTTREAERGSYTQRLSVVLTEAISFVLSEGGCTVLDNDHCELILP